MNDEAKMIQQAAADVSADPAERKSWLDDILVRGAGEYADEAGLLRYMHNYADAVAKNVKDFKHSAAIRQIIENPDSASKAYKNLLNAARFHIIANLLHEMANNSMAAANGLLKAATGVIPQYEPAIYVSDNHMGRFIMDSLEDFHVKIGASGPFIKQKVNTDNLFKNDGSGPGKKIIVD